MSACGALEKLTGSPFATRKMSLRSGGTLPSSIDLRGATDGPVKNQQMVGVCWSFALSSIMENALRRQGQADVVAPLHLIASDAWSDLHTRGATDAMVGESTWPYDPAKACKLKESPRDEWCEDSYHVTQGSWAADPSLHAEVDSANARGTYKVSKLEAIDPPTFEALADELASGREVYAAFRIDEAAWSHPRGDSIDDYNGEERGPHAVTLVGFRTNGPRGRELLIKNSWGPDWGEGGYAWLSEHALQQHGDDFFTVEVNGVAPSIGPGQNGFPFPIAIPGLPAPSQVCAQPQVRDVVLGSCANACPNGSPPAAGACTGFTLPGFPQNPSQPPQAACAAGQVQDLVTRACSAPCRNGMAPAAGACLP